MTYEDRLELLRLSRQLQREQDSQRLIAILEELRALIDRVLASETKRKAG